MNDRARKILDQLPGIKQCELKPCALCGRGLAHDGNMLFWRLSFDRLGLDAGAIERQHGLELMLGSPLLANVMGPDRDIAKIIDGDHRALVCEPCALERLSGLFSIAEAQNEKAAEEFAGSSSSARAPGFPPGDAVSNPSPAPHQPERYRR